MRKSIEISINLRLVHDYRVPNYCNRHKIKTIQEQKNGCLLFRDVWSPTAIIGDPYKYV